MHPEPDSLAEAEVRAVARLLSEAARLPGEHLVRKCHVLDGLCDLVGADEWEWVVSPARGSTLSISLRHGSRSMADGREAACTRATSTPPGPGHIVSSTHRLEDGRESRLALHRTRSDRSPYSPRETCLARLVLDEVPWLHRTEGPSIHPAPATRLSPRQQRVFALMQVGSGRKEIAAELGIAVGTVSSYARELYQCFAVKTHAELMRLPWSSTGTLHP